MRFESLFLSAAVAAVVAAAPSPVAHVLHERREGLSYSFEKSDDEVDRAGIVPVRVGMTQQNLEAGHHMLMDVSTHDSPNYGKHYTQEQIHDIFAPSKETVEAVREWLESSGISKGRISQSFNKQWLQFDAPISELEDLVKTKFHLFTHHSGELHMACDEYHVPEHLVEHIDYITPGIRHLPLAKHKQKRSLEKRSRFKLPVITHEPPMTNEEIAQGGLGLCSAVASPECIKRLYNITVGTTAASGNKLGIFEDLDDHYSQADLNSFFAAAYSVIPQGTGPELRAVDGAIGAFPVANAGPESDLDFQISYPIIWPQQSVLFQTDDEPYESNYTYIGFLNHLLEAIDGSYCAGKPSPFDPPYPDPAPGGYKGTRQCGVYEPTHVISISYGGGEIDVPPRYFKRQCQEYMKLGMQGISVVVSSGDYGVAIYPGDGSPNGCLVEGERWNEGNPSPKNGTCFHPDFPAACPYITTLGSTFLPAGADVTKDQEIATTRFPSGGGFSNIFPTPEYQNSAVQGYLLNHPPPYKSYNTTNGQNICTNGGIYNQAGRGFPDFAAVGDNVLIYNKGRPLLIGGTSASAPTFAAILTRINEERIAANKSTIGFVNPTLYAHPEVFHDITVGSNPGCGTNGFSAAPGWDPVTGLGTPNYPAVLKLFMSLQ